MLKLLMSKCKSAKMGIRSADEVEINIIYVQFYGVSSNTKEKLELLESK